MSTEKRWFPESAFDNDRKPSEVVALQTQQKAVAYLRAALTDHYCVRVLIGPAKSGKSTIVHQFVAGLRQDIAVAVIDGCAMSPQKLLTEILVEFGYSMNLKSPDDLLRMVNIFVVQQIRSSQAPILIVENVERMQPASLRVLCLIASFTHQGNFATRIVLTGTRRAMRLLSSNGMSTVSERMESVYEVKPLTRHESTAYLQGRIVANGINQPDTALPVDVCIKIYELSGGLPGSLNEAALGTLEQSVELPAKGKDVERYEESRKMTDSKPRIILTRNGETIGEFSFKDRKVSIGRSNLADIVINSEYASKFHVLLLYYPDSLILVDLNSANGTFVNSVRVDSTLLKSGDIVSLANHRMKILDAPAPESTRVSHVLQDTTTMKTLDDMRVQRNMKFPFINIRRRLDK